MFNVLLISTHAEDATELMEMLRPIPVAFEHVPNFKQARNQFNREKHRVIFTEASLPDASWRDVLSLAQETCNVPKCHFLVMDSVHLALRNKSFDAVICVEAAFHFRTREKFLREANRILRPGGHLVISDIMYSAWSEIANETAACRGSR